MSSMQKVLVIQLARMGDVLQSSALVQGIREKNPDAMVTFLTSEKTRDVASSIGGVDDVISLDFGQASGIASDREAGLSERYRRLSSLMNDLKGRCFDLVYNLNYSCVNTGLMNLIRYRRALCYSLDTSRRQIVKSPWLSYLLSMLGDRRLNLFNLVDLYLRGSGLSVRKPSLSFQLDRRAMDSVDRFLTGQGIQHRERLVGFQLGAGDSVRCWPVDSYRVLADRLIRRRGVRILLFGTSSETPQAEALKACFTAEGTDPTRRGLVIDLVGKTSTRELACFLRRCDLLVTPDTGTMHLACAVGTRVLALFMGSAFPHETGPYGTNHFVLRPVLPCYPCFEGGPSCTSQECKRLIRPEKVALVVERLLAGNNGDLEKGVSDFLDSNLILLRSAMTPDCVGYSRVCQSTASLEDVFALAYRAMWQGVLDEDRICNSSGQANVLEALAVPLHGGDLVGDLKEAERDFDRLQRMLGAYGASMRGGNGPSGPDLNLMAATLRSEEDKRSRWAKPIPRFFDVEYANIRLSGRDVNRRVERLVGGLAWGAGFMKAFVRRLVRTLSS